MFRRRKFMKEKRSTNNGFGAFTYKTTLGAWLKQLALVLYIQFLRKIVTKKIAFCDLEPDTSLLLSQTRKDSLFFFFFPEKWKVLLKNRLKGYFFSALGYRLLQQLYTHEKHFVCEFFPFKIDGTWMQRKILPRHFPTVWLKVISRNENILPDQAQNNIPNLLYSPWKNSYSKSFKSQKFLILSAKRCVNIVNITKNIDSRTQIAL